MCSRGPARSRAESHYLLAVADVAGKSIPAAMLMATFQASLRTLSGRPGSLADLVRGMNQYACTNSQGGLRFTTAFVGEYDPGARTLTYVNAGHNLPMLCRKSGCAGTPGGGRPAHWHHGRRALSVGHDHTRSRRLAGGLHRRCD